MIKKRQRKKLIEAIYTLISDDGVHASFIDDAVIRVVMLPKFMFEKDYPLGKSLYKMKQPVLFENRYVCCEAAVLSYILIDRTLFFKSDDYDKYFVFISAMFQKLKTAVGLLYGFSSSEIDSLYDKRSPFFEKVLLDSEDDDITVFIDEALLLFSHVYCEEKFINFSSSTPLLLLDALTELNYRIQVSEYYKKIAEYIDNELLSRLNDAELSC